MIIVVAALEFHNQADRDSAVELTREVQLATRVEEAGCYDYCFAPDPSVPTRIQVYELWEDSDTLAAHFEHPNYHKMVELLGQANIKESINQAYLVERGEPVYGPNGEKKTAFFQDYKCLNQSTFSTKPSCFGQKTNRWFATALYGCAMGVSCLRGRPRRLASRPATYRPTHKAGASSCPV